MQTEISSNNPAPAPSMSGAATSRPAGMPEDVPADFDSLTSLQRWKLGLSLLRKVLNNPQDTEQVLAFLSVINSGQSNRNRVAKFFANPEGEVLYAEHRAIDSRTIDLDKLAALPEGTLATPTRRSCARTASRPRSSTARPRASRTRSDPTWSSACGRPMTCGTS